MKAGEIKSGIVRLLVDRLCTVYTITIYNISLI